MACKIVAHVGCIQILEVVSIEIIIYKYMYHQLRFIHPIIHIPHPSIYPLIQSSIHLPSTLIPPSYILSSIPPSCILSSIPPSYILSSIPPSCILSSIPPSYILSSIPPSSILSSIPPSYILSSIPPSYILSSIHPSTLIPLSYILSSIPPCTCSAFNPHSLILMPVFQIYNITHTFTTTRGNNYRRLVIARRLPPFSFGFS